jgi:hypothetical protein
MDFCGHTSYGSLEFLGWCSSISLHTLGNVFAKRFQTNHDVAQVVVPDCLYAAGLFLE